MGVEIVIVHVGASTLAGQEQRFFKECVRIGRAIDNDAMFDFEQDLKVSSFHAELYVEGQGLYIRDVGSRNGTYVNGTRIAQPVPVCEADDITLGRDGPHLRVRLLAGRNQTMDQDDNSSARMARERLANLGVDEQPPAGQMPASPRENRRGNGQEVDPQATPIAVMSEATPHKRLVGENTLHRVVMDAVAKERQKSHRVLQVTLATCAALVVFCLLLYWKTQADVAHQTQQVKDEWLAKEQQNPLRQVLDLHAAEIKELKDKITDSEKEIAGLIVRIQDRKEEIVAVSKRGGLTDQQRQTALEDAETKLKQMLDELGRRQNELRRVDDSAVWGTLSEKYKHSVFLCVGEGAKDKVFGTAFVIRADGLLATNAHVIKQMEGKSSSAIQNETGKSFRILRAEPHPDYSSVDSPDVGLIQLELTSNMKLLPFDLATTEDLRQLRIGTHLGTLGFPGEFANKYVDKQGRKDFTGAIATFKDGWVGRVTNFKRERADFADSVFVQHSGSLTGGTSGSPMFTSAGKVVAVNNGYWAQERTVARQQGPGRTEFVTETQISAAQISFAIRIDVLEKFAKSSGW